MYFNTLKRGLGTLLLVGVLYGMELPSAFAQTSFNQNCITYNKHFIARYFTGSSAFHEIAGFFKCMDDSIQFFLNHTSTGHPGYYTELEMTRFLQYMGFRRFKASHMSRALFGIKQGLIGGRPGQLSLYEIRMVRRILWIVKGKLERLHRVVPVLQAVLQNRSQGYREDYLSYAAAELNRTISHLGGELSQLPIQMNLALLQSFPQHIEVLGFPSSRLQYWSDSLALIRQWRKTFSGGWGHIVAGVAWRKLLQSFGGLAELWVYYKAFLENRALLSVPVVQRTQYFISRLFSIFKNSYSVHRNIALTELDALAKKVWFFPWLSTPVAKLSMRSIFCFVLDRLAFQKSCPNQMVFNEQSGALKVDFGDLDFTVMTNGRMQMRVAKKGGGNLSKAHIRAVEQYLQRWIRSEQVLRQTGSLPDVFGSPQAWLNRNIRLTGDERLLFLPAGQKVATGDKGRGVDLALLSHLNWGSHLMQMMAAAIGVENANSQVDRHVWTRFVQEVSILATAFYPGTHWKVFQSEGFSFFSLGDFLTAGANGDGILQDKELLELFALSFSAWRTVRINQVRLDICSVTNTVWSRQQCVFNTFRKYPDKFYLSFPALRGWLSLEWDGYSEVLRRFEDPLENIFTVFVLTYYQENILEYLDRDFSGDLDIAEVHPLADVFQQMLLDEFPW